MRKIHICAAIGIAAGISLGALAAYAGKTADARPPVEMRSLDASTTLGPQDDPATAADPADAAGGERKSTPPTHPAGTSGTGDSSAQQSGAPGGDDVATAAGSRDWQLLASDEFNGSSLDTNRWTVYNGVGNAGVGSRRPEAVSVSNGTLKVTGRGDVSGGLNWKGGRTYGRWEIRARNDFGNGYAPNLLLWPSSGNWPAEGEINIMEIPWGNRIQSLFVIHWGPENNQVSHIEPGDFTRWHTFALEWLPSHITLFIDGQPIYTNDDPAIVDALRYPMHLSIQNDVGPSGGFIPPRDQETPAAVSLEVDWVRIYAP